MPLKLVLEINVFKIYFNEDFLNSYELNLLFIIFQPFYPAQEILFVLERPDQDSFLKEEWLH